MQNRTSKTFCFLLLNIISFTIFGQNPPSDSSFKKDILPRINFLASEYEIDNLMDTLSLNNKPGTYILNKVNIVSVKNNAIEKNMSLLIRNSIIEKIGKSDSFPTFPNAIQIDGKGKYLFPGLTDMHFHLSLSSSHRLLLLLNGVTTIRNMTGTSWILKEKEKIKKNELLAPNIYTTGPILSYEYFGLGEARTRINTTNEARETVKKQKLAGYDFIKVHDGMNLEVYKAIINEANNQNIKVVGHCPDKVKIKDAIELGQFTIEHLTGYFSLVKSKINRENLEITNKKKPWICPTTTLKLGFASKEKKISYLKSSSDKTFFNPFWVNLEMKNKETSLMRMFYKKVTKQYDKAFNELLIKHEYKKIISGTDAGQYTILLPGVSLHEELNRMEYLGIPTIDVLKSTTLNAAAALQKSDEMGSIKEGMRADFILLDKNPIESSKNLSSIRGIMIRGNWLTETTIKNTKRKIKDIYKLKTYNKSEIIPLINKLYKKYINHPGVDLRENLALAVILYHYKKRNESISILEKLIANNTIIWDVYEFLGLLYMEIGNKKLALKNYKNSLALNPNNKKTKEFIKSLEN